MIERAPLWMAKAACANGDPDTFFTDSATAPRGRPASPPKVHPAVAICNGCPVSAECLEYAISNGITHGIFGGKTERERQKLRRQRGLVQRYERHGTHGISGYKRGCKCDVCREAHRVDNAARRQAARAS